MADGTQVDLVALTGYANSMGKGADDQLTWGTTQRTNMAATSGTMMANTAHGFKESNAFHNYHQTMVRSAAQFLNDMAQGTAAISMAAETAAINYADADQLGAFNMAALKGQLDADSKAIKDGKSTNLYADMTPVFSGGRSMATVTAKDVNTAFTPKAGDDQGASDNSPADGTKKPVVPTDKQVDDQFTKMEGQAKTNLDKNGDTMTQDQRNIVYGDNGYTVQGSDKNSPVYVPQTSVTRQTVEGGVPVTPEHKIDH